MPVTKIDRRGRITIPKEIRRELNLKEDEELLIFRLAGNILLLRKADLSKLVIDAIKEFRELKDEDMERIEAEINRLAREKIEKIEGVS
ncbi:MAG: Transcriptional regulator, AbrB family [Archaeoglobus fulgidus]|jgi:AbrB family looped-hinge helix DNA binding protein|uniref:Transcriptional regulator, AbrB family n=1 Tax=Archaeoglobus fulgidus TaxID=2234 RepID=A0A101E386_ARCFL|nr:MAG: Transcriptional regulator, AbrB family [Archaeoglobus fulgidus]